MVEKSQTYRAIFETGGNPYTAYYDSSHPNKARAFFEKAQKTLEKQGGIFKLVSFGPYKKPWPGST
jgi:hypothetical protein